MRKIWTLLLTLCVAGMLCGCGSAGEDADAQGESVAAEGSQEAVGDTGGDVSENAATSLDAVDATETVAQEAENDGAEEEAEGSSEIEAWFEAQGFTEPTIVIVDGLTYEATIVENGGEYDFEEDDKLYLYYAVPIHETIRSYTIEFGDTYPTYCELLVASEDVVVCIMELVSEGTTYKHDFILNRVYKQKVDKI